MAIGKRIEDLARERKINLKELSRQANVSYNTLYAIVKRNNDSVRPDILQSVAKALNVSVDELLGIKPKVQFSDDDVEKNIDVIIDNWVAYKDKTPMQVMEEIKNLPPHYAKMLADYIEYVNKK